MPFPGEHQGGQRMLYLDDPVRLCVFQDMTGEPFVGADPDCGEVRGVIHKFRVSPSEDKRGERAGMVMRVTFIGCAYPCQENREPRGLYDLPAIDELFTFHRRSVMSHETPAERVVAAFCCQSIHCSLLLVCLRILSRGKQAIRTPTVFHAHLFSKQGPYPDGFTFRSGCEIRTREAVTPTALPMQRPKPLGEPTIIRFLNRNPLTILLPLNPKVTGFHIPFHLLFRLYSNP